MPKKPEPTQEDVESHLERLDVLLAQYDKDFPPDEDEDDDLDFYGLGPVDHTPLAARNKGRTPNEILADKLPSEGAAASPLPQVGEGLGVRGGKHEIPKQTSSAEPDAAKNTKIPKQTSQESVGQGKGGGPKTAAGKAVVARNPTKHGIMSNAPVVDDFETMDAWQEHLQGIRDSIDPQSPLEESLTFRLAGVLWRLHRVTRHETASIKLNIASRRRRWEENEDALAGLGEPPGDPEELKTKIDYGALPDDEVIEKVIKYETSLHRQSLQLLHELEAFAARRSGQPTPLARLDISGPPS